MKFVDMLQTITIYCKILVIDQNQYTNIVVEDLRREYADDLKYVTVTVLPNWEIKDVELGNIGYLQFQSVEGGKTQYFKRVCEDFETYKYTNNYFISFLKEKELCKQDKFEF